MGNRKDLSPRNKGQINALLKHSNLKQKEAAKKLNILTQTIRAIRKKLKMRRNIHSSRTGKITLRLDRKIKATALKDRKASGKRLYIKLAIQEILVDRKTINYRLLEQELKAYRPRKECRWTQKMKQA